MAKTATELTSDLSLTEAYYVIGWLSQRIESNGLARTKDVRQAVEAAKGRSATWQ